MFFSSPHSRASFLHFSHPLSLFKWICEFFPCGCADFYLSVARQHEFVEFQFQFSLSILERGSNAFLQILSSFKLIKIFAFKQNYCNEAIVRQTHARVVFSRSHKRIFYITVMKIFFFRRRRKLNSTIIISNNEIILIPFWERKHLSVRLIIIITFFASSSSPTTLAHSIESKRSSLMMTMWNFNLS